MVVAVAVKVLRALEAATARLMSGSLFVVLFLELRRLWRNEFERGELQGRDCGGGGGGGCF